MPKYPLSYIVYIAISFLLGLILFFSLHTVGSLAHLFIIISILFLLLSSILIFKNKNTLSIIFAMLSIFFIAYLYGSYRYKYIEHKINYSNNITAFTAEVISYEGEFEYKYGTRERYICEVSSIYNNTNWYNVYFKIRLYNASKKEIQVGDKLIVNSKLNFYKNILTNDNEEYDNETIINALENKMLVGVSSIYRPEKFVIEKRHFKLVNILNKYSKKMRNYIDTTIKNNNIEADNIAIIKSIVLGDKRELTNKLRNIFSNVGLSHILAVSGLHLSIVVLIFNFALYYIIRNAILRFSLSIILAVLLFAPITLFSTSVVRASIMYLLIFSVLITGKKLNSLHNLFLAALIILLANPTAILDISFQFSFLATLGIITYYSVYQSIQKSRAVAFLTNWLALSISAILMITPLAMYNFKVLNLNSIVSNIYAGIYTFVIIMLTFINAMLYKVIPILHVYSSRLLNKVVSSFVLIAEKQATLNILKYDFNINLFTTLIITFILSALGIILKMINSKNTDY